MQNVGGRMGDKVPELDIGALKKSFFDLREALAGVDISEIVHVFNALKAANDESEKLRAILDRLINATEPVLAASEKEGGLVEGEATDKLFRDLDSALTGVKAVREWLDQRIPRVWR